MYSGASRGVLKRVKGDRRDGLSDRAHAVYHYLNDKVRFRILGRASYSGAGPVHAVDLPALTSHLTVHEADHTLPALGSIAIGTHHGSDQLGLY